MFSFQQQLFFKKEIGFYMELRRISYDVRCENMFEIKEIENHLNVLLELDEENSNLANDYHQLYNKVFLFLFHNIIYINRMLRKHCKIIFKMSHC